jgi:PAS domain S-box-containing protein
MKQREWKRKTPQKSEDPYRSFFEHTVEGFFRSTPAGRFLEVNPALVCMLGYESAAEVLALTLPDDLYVDPAQREHLRAHYETTGVVAGEELYWKKKKGEPIIVSLHARTLRDARGRVVGYEGMVIDITERKRMEEALRESEARYRTISDLISDYAYAVRIEPDGRTVVEWVTEAFARITGFTVHQLDARGGIIGLIHPEDLPSVLQRLSVLLAGQPGISEHRIITKSGAVRWLRDYSCPEWDASQQRVVRIIGAGQDITERKQAEVALTASEARYRTVFAASPDFIYLTDNEGKLLDANPALLAWQGLSLAELQQRHFLDFFAGDNREEVVQASAALRLGQPVRGLAVWARNKRGERKEFEVNATPLRDQDGSTMILSIARDLTEHRRAEAALATLSRHVLEAQEAERRHLAYELHDEFGQELTALKFMLQMVEGIPAAAVQRLQDSITIVDNLLARVRTLSLDLRPLMLDDLGLAAALDWYGKRQAQRGGFVLHLTIDALAPRPHPAIETACFRVVQEAVTNVARHAQTQQVWVEVRQRDGALFLSVRDAGIGFDVEAVRAQAGQGQGLGLVGMEERVRLVGGQLEIVTAPGRGTEIRAHVPLQEA